MTKDVRVIPSGLLLELIQDQNRQLDRIASALEVATDD